MTALNARDNLSRNRWIPADVRARISPKQAEFLLHDGQEAMYGGAAGGGKSFALLMAALQYADVPGYHALILRRTFKQLDKPDSIMFVARQWLTGTGARWNEQKHQWTFPSGATLTFGHMEGRTSYLDYQGSAYAYVGYDELTQFQQEQYLYLFSRLRRPEGSRLPMRMRSASNPGGIGHEWVKKRFIVAESRQAGAVFVPARLQDNPNIDVEEYLRSLAHLDPVTKAQLLAGDWNAMPGGRFRREWFHYYRVINQQFKQGGELEMLGSGRRPWRRNECWCMQTVDPAASDEHLAKSDDPDYTVISTWLVTPQPELLWWDCHYFRKEIPEILPELDAQYRLHRPLFVAIEAVGANRAVYQYAKRTHMNVREVGTWGKTKLVRATPAMVMMQEGRLWLPEKARWKDDVETQLLLFTGNDKEDAHDDIIDTASMAAQMLDGGEIEEPGGGAAAVGALGAGFAGRGR